MFLFIRFYKSNMRFTKNFDTKFENRSLFTNFLSPSCQFFADKEPPVLIFSVTYYMYTPGKKSCNPLFSLGERVQVPTLLLLSLFHP